MAADHDRKFMALAVALSAKNFGDQRWRPFGAVIVLNETVIGEGSNETLFTNDSTAHAEIVAIRDACRRLNTYLLPAAEIYCSSEPCPMCLGAIYWSEIRKIYYGCRSEDLSMKGFKDSDLYGQMAIPAKKRTVPSEEILRQEALDVLHRFKRGS